MFPRHRTLAARAVALHAIALACTIAACAADPAQTPASPIVVLDTNLGPIVLELDPDRAPVGVANFLRYVNDGSYNGSTFHRVVPGFVIQGGGYTHDLVELKAGPPIANEWRNGLKNTRGAVAWARDPAPDTATREFYINLADNPKLDEPRPTTGDAGYAVFGRVIEGMEVVDAIAAVKTRPIPERDMKDVPVEPVVIENARLRK